LHIGCHRYYQATVTVSEVENAASIGREVELTELDMLGRKFAFKPGHSFFIQEWFFPGKPEVIIPNDSETVKIFEGAPFKVIHKDHRP
jgi:hypothetical protein